MPIRVVFRWIGVDCFVLAAMHRQVSLTIAVEIEERRVIRSETGVLKIAVETALPFHCTVRGSPTLTEVTFIDSDVRDMVVSLHGLGLGLALPLQSGTTCAASRRAAEKRNELVPLHSGLAKHASAIRQSLLHCWIS